MPSCPTVTIPNLFRTTNRAIGRASENTGPDAPAKNAGAQVLPLLNCFRFNSAVNNRFARLNEDGESPRRLHRAAAIDSRNADPSCTSDEPANSTKVPTQPQIEAPWPNCCLIPFNGPTRLSPDRVGQSPRLAIFWFRPTRASGPLARKSKTRLGSASICWGAGSLHLYQPVPVNRDRAERSWPTVHPV